MHHTHLLLVYVSRDTIKQMHLFRTIKRSLAFLKMNAYMHLLSKWSNVPSHNNLWMIKDWTNLSSSIQRSLLDYTHMTSCFSTQLDTLSLALCSDMEIDLSEADPCSIRQWRQIDNANLKYSIYYSANDLLLVNFMYISKDIDACYWVPIFWKVYLSLCICLLFMSH